MHRKQGQIQKAEIRKAVQFLGLKLDRKDEASLIDQINTLLKDVRRLDQVDTTGVSPSHLTPKEEDGLS